MRNLKLQYIFLMPVLLLLGFFLSSCCSPKDCEIKVTFVGVDEDLDLENYSYYVSFNEPTSITIDIPAGYDHTKVSTTIDGHEQASTVEFEEEIDEEFQYSIAKSLTYNIKFVKRSFEYVVDLTQMPKLEFDIKLMTGMDNLKVVTVKDGDKLKGLKSLTNSVVDSIMEFEDDSVSVRYGEHVFLVQNTSGVRYDAMYSRITRFTPEINKASIESIPYAKYEMAKKGNVRYYFNNDAYTSIYYLGEIKEDVALYNKIPSYNPEKGFKIEKDPNMFYLFTNLTEYNSEMFSLETYTSTTDTYNAGNGNQDKIGDVTIEKVEYDSIFNDRHNIHKIYLGSDLANDGLLNTEQKKNVRKDLYLKISTSLGVENFDFKLLKYEKDDITQYLLTADKISARGYTYIKLDEEDLAYFSVKKEHKDVYGQSHSYQSGSAIFYPRLKDNISIPNKKLTKIWMQELVQNNYDLNEENFHFALYIKDSCGNKDYGLIDTNELNDGHGRDVVYFDYSKLFDDNGDYKNSLYCEIRGEKYKDYSSLTIRYVDVYMGYHVHDVLNKDPLYVENAKVYNGYKDYLITFRKKEVSNVYTIGVKITVNNPMAEQINIDFSQMYLGNNVVYITNNINFNSINDFNVIRETNKGSINNIKISANYDVYYFVRNVDMDNYDFDLYLDYNNRDTKISISKQLCDVTGKPITIEINGEPYNVKVICQDVIYETLEKGKIYAVQK